MSDSWQDSVVRIENSMDKNSFGTGFPIYHQGIATYIATCAHVVNDIGQDNLRIFGKSAILAVPILEGIDLAVLRVELDRDVFVPPLPVRHAFNEFGVSFTTAGYLRAGDMTIFRGLNGVFEKQIYVGAGGQRQLTKAWDIKIVDENPLQRGYSGSPVVDKNDYVVGVVITLQGDGKKGIAIAAEALKSVMKNAPWKQLLEKDSEECKRYYDMEEQARRKSRARKSNEPLRLDPDFFKFLSEPHLPLPAILQDYRNRHGPYKDISEGLSFFTPPPDYLSPNRISRKASRPISQKDLARQIALAIEEYNETTHGIPTAFSNCWNKPQENVDLKNLEDLLCQLCMTDEYNKELLKGLLFKFGLWPIFDTGRSTGFTLLTVPDKKHLDEVISELDLSRAQQRKLFLAAGYTEKTPGCWLD